MADVLHRDRFNFADLAVAHPIGADIFVPFAVVRLGGQVGVTKAELLVELRGVGGGGASERRLELCWSADSVPAQPLAVPQRDVTEWAACAIACVVTHVYGQLQVCAVTGDGDRFDYWVTDGQRQFGLEVSGTVSGDLERRHRTKTDQLLDNPFGVDGYVVVVDFTARRVIFSFHQYQELRP
jgi:hypothetical protein